MTNLNACLSSKRHDWRTPKDLFARYDLVHEFDLDAAATFDNTLCENFIGPPGYVVGHHELMSGPRTCVAVDALQTEVWPGECIWLNPPYGRGLGKWYAKAVEQVRWFGKTVVMLVPARTDTKYWHEYVWDADHGRPRHWVRVIDWLKGRVHFGLPGGGDAGPAPFPSAVIWLGRED